MLSKRQGLLLTTAVAPAVWATTYLVTSELLPPGRPFLAGAVRALPAGLLLVAITRQLPHGAWWWRSLVLGALNIGGFFALLFVAAYRLPGGVAAAVGALQPLFVALLAVVVLGQRLTARTLVAGALGVVGVSLLVLRGETGLDTVGVLAAAGAAVSMSCGVILAKRWVSPASLLATTGWQLTAGGLLLVAPALALEGLPSHVTGQNLAGYAYLTLVGSVLGYSLWFRGLRALPATDVTFLGLLNPVVATALGWAVLGQTLTPLQLLGGVVVLVSLVVAQRQRPPRADDLAR
ncbi:predicted permease, DMT superfamily [Sanguibacter keddieii DSM 10542]|uniref:Predicted permease, DMT superfamily n=1 Tax=Sanguibacter keddieii (strain ATCC 51767 / DSM 10542 / NCFB 3025 / ST-74) TaxID=446469 RepID=D1BK22_SANKS|nr:EamA family transporter [Sanguibacter keddieii]ACZ22431.1 predicted permease, DMT superfamily [Sanguibacter keddieii DSM 10542]